MAVGQSAYLLLIHRFRKQARSHIFELWQAQNFGQTQISVGAGLPAMAVGQSAYLLLIHRFREQARLPHF
ncbi:hypothetical protein A7J50_4955 [Pseudomonas antarctica]|uniref:Uncharacterized protein n=1 Tax=Pseudomonas antarctica TaxID=219572 RepID=A0A172Z7I8_9PSED|nr:hypothetical protein A7J50_4955 [Pseudomonas antarctica]